MPFGLGNCELQHHKSRCDEYIKFLALEKASQTAAITVSELHGGNLLNVSRENCRHFRNKMVNIEEK